MLKVILFLVLAVSPAFSQTVVKIVDGDTFKAAWNGDTVTIRLCGVDTPESKKNAKAKKDALRSGQDIQLITNLGKRSTLYLKHIMPVGSHVTFEFDVRERDRYGRLLAYVYLGKQMVNEQLVKDGYATTMTIAPNVKYAERFRNAEREAREMNRGLWR